VCPASLGREQDLIESFSLKSPQQGEMFLRTQRTKAPDRARCIHLSSGAGDIRLPQNIACEPIIPVSATGARKGTAIAPNPRQADVINVRFIVLSEMISESSSSLIFIDNSKEHKGKKPPIGGGIVTN